MQARERVTISIHTAFVARPIHQYLEVEGDSVRRTVIRHLRTRGSDGVVSNIPILWSDS